MNIVTLIIIFRCVQLKIIYVWTETFLINKDHHYYNKISLHLFVKCIMSKLLFFIVNNVISLYAGIALMSIMIMSINSINCMSFRFCNLWRKRIRNWKFSLRSFKNYRVKLKMFVIDRLLVILFNWVEFFK